MALTLGWLQLRLEVVDIDVSRAFWETLGFVPLAAQQSPSHAIMHNAASELALCAGADEDGSAQIHFRGADIAAWREHIRALGPGGFDEGTALPDGSGAFSVLDPAGNRVCFESTSEERLRFEAGMRQSGGDGSLQQGQPLLGRLEICLFVGDVADCQSFYQLLGFQRIAGEMKHNWVVLADGWNRIGIYGRQHQGDFPDLLLSFRGGDVESIAARLKSAGLELDVDANLEDDGTMGCILSDPDGWCIYFNTDPAERMY